jgi:[acyl-carrier-protein] S-malonyltransferase
MSPSCCCDADADELRDTRNAQLTTFVSSLMVLDAVERLGVEPSFCAGHSLGEYTALTATGRSGSTTASGSSSPAPRRCTTPARPTGHDGARLGLDDDQVEIACRRADADVWVANFNAPARS